MDENTFKKQIEEQLRNKIKGYLQGGCFWSIDHNLTTGIVIDNIEQVIEELVQIASQHPKLTSHKYDNNKSKSDNIKEINEIIEQNIEQNIGILTYAISNGKTEKVTFMSQPIKLDVVMCTKLQNGKIIERTFGTKENGQQYTPEEIKVILKEAEEVECDEKFKDGRVRKYSLLSMIVDIDTSILRSQYPLIVVAPDNKDKDKVYEEIKQTINKAKQDPNSPNILLIPYSADGHIVTLLVDKREFPNRNSIACFDSSHYFNKFGSLNPKHFSKDLLYTLDAHQKPINKSIIQKLSSTCSFYTEAFCYLVSKYIQDNKDNKNFGLSNIEEYINSKEFIKQLEDKKEEFFNEYKTTMEEVKQKQEQQKENIKQEITDNITVQQNKQLTPDERHYQQLLNQYGVYRYGQEFVDDINSINNSNPLNSNQQNALVREFIGSDVLTRLNGGREIIVGFNHNREAFMNIIHDARQPNSVLNGGTAPVNFIYTLGTENNQNADAGTHYVAAQIFRDESTGRLVVLHYDSLNGTVNDEFEKYIRNEFRENIQIINISNHNRFTQQEQGVYTCGLCALTALRDNGILDQGREYIIEHNLFQVTNLDIPNIQQQTLNTPTSTITEESLGASQLSPHSITPSKTSSTQSISSSSSSTTEHSQTPQQQTPTQSQNSQSTQSQLQQSQIISSLVNTQANNVSHNESSQQSTPPQTLISPPPNSSTPSMGSSNN